MLHQGMFKIVFKFFINFLGSGATVPLVSPVTSNVMIGGVMSPAAVPLQRPMFNSPGNLGV